LQQSLAARLDRLGPAREVAQIGAVLGREFAYPLLRDIAELDEPAVQASLDRLADADLLFVEGAPPEATYRFKHALVQDAAYDSLLKSRRQVLHRRAAEILCDEPERATAEPEMIAHHFTEAGFDDLAIEWWGKAGDQALRRSAFQEAIAHLGKAIEMADRAGGASQAGSKDTAAASQRLKLQNDYGLAVTHSKGYAAAETEAAFARASELASNSADFSERFAAVGGQFRVALIRGELRLAHEVASKFLQEAERAGRGVDAGTACGCLAIVSYYSGSFAEARTYGERALDACDPARDQETRVRYGYDTGTVAMCCLAQTCWQLGEVERARELINRATRRGAELGHAPSLTEPLAWKAILEVIRGDVAAALSAAKALEAHAREHGMMFHCVLAELFGAWPSGRLNDPATGVAQLKKALAAAVDQGSKLAREFWETRAAELEAEAVGVESALARLKEALALTHQGECRFHLSFLHRVRGDLLLKRDPVEPSLAEEAFSTAIAVAKEQGARSYHLQAALPLAKLYQSTGHTVEAHAVLAPALEGFSPTPEMPEIAEAQALLVALKETNEVKADAAHRERRLRLQTSYGRAMMWSKGFAADETKAAFLRARELKSNADESSERLAAYYGQCIGRISRGESWEAEDTARKYLREAEAAKDRPHAAHARNWLGLTLFLQGKLSGAESVFERVLVDWRPTPDGEQTIQDWIDPGVYAASLLAHVVRVRGDLRRYRELGEQALLRAAELGHVQTTARAHLARSEYAVTEGDAAAALHSAERLLAFAQEHATEFYAGRGEVYSAWARFQLSLPQADPAELRQAIANHIKRGNLASVPWFLGLLAACEADAQYLDAAFTTIEEALSRASETGQRAFDSLLHRVRGDILLKRDPVDPALAEAAYKTAIAVAKEQGARSYELLAALSLAKVYQSTASPADAHAVLAPTLEGFTPTPEMPEIAEAQALLLALAQSDEVKAYAAQRERRLRLQTSYGQAMLWSKGFAAEDKTAFARAAELEGNADSSSKRLAAYDRQCSVLLFRGQSREAEDTTRKYLHEAETAQDGPHAAHARTWLGLTFFVRGKLSGAESAFERVLVDWSPASDGRQTIQDWIDPGVHAASHLAQVVWVKGDFQRYRELSEQALRRAAELGHVQTAAHAHVMRLNYAFTGGDPAAVLHSAEGCVAFARERGMEYYANYGDVALAWARFRLSLPQADPAELRQAIANYVNCGNVLVVPHFLGLLAACEADAQNLDVASSTIEEALTRASETGQGWADAFLHRLSGDIQFKRDPVDPARAEEAYKTAIAVAREQGARSWELLAALSLAKLHQSMGRPLEAHAVLAPALEGFSPTPEMPEIAEAQVLLMTVASRSGRPPS
jgi:predicted ATPase